MRKRKHPEKPQRVYKFRAYPKEIPQEMWNTAKAMQALWNSLVHYRNWLSGEVQQGAADWSEWDGIVKYLAGRSGLNWECGPALVDRFRSACSSAAKGLRAWPKTQHGLRRIMIPHRFSGGGILAERLYSKRAERIRLDRTPAGAYDHNSQLNRLRRVVPAEFGLSNGETIETKVRLHRQIPDDAMVKQASWSGDRFGKTWEWHALIQVEESPIARRLTGLRCGIDAGWRLMDGCDIRVAMISDSAGNTIECRIPLMLDNAHSRRHGGSISLHGWPDLRDVDAKKDNAKNAKDWIAFERFSSIRRHLYRRLTRRRDWIYQNLAAWAADRYDEIAIEGDLAVKVMAEEKEKNYALDAADRYRQIAAPASLLGFIKTAAKFRGSKIIPALAAYTTLSCWICAARLDKQNGSLFLKCPSGHVWDQDENAARNLLSQTSPQNEPDTGFREINVEIAEQLVKYLSIMKDVARAVHAG